MIGGWKEKQVSMIGDFITTTTPSYPKLVGTFGVDGFSICDVRSSFIDGCNRNASGLYSKSL